MERSQAGDETDDRCRIPSGSQGRAQDGVSRNMPLRNMSQDSPDQSSQLLEQKLEDEFQGQSIESETRPSWWARQIFDTWSFEFLAIAFSLV